MDQGEKRQKKKHQRMREIREQKKKMSVVAIVPLFCLVAQAASFFDLGEMKKKFFLVHSETVSDRSGKSTSGWSNEKYEGSKT
jgi:hypothetical protein